MLLRYRAGDFNRLHQDLYGAVAFPFQVIICLSRHDEEFTGGELLLMEEQRRTQPMGHVIRLEQGEAVVASRCRPVKTSIGYRRSTFRHGVGPLLSGERFSLGLVFHDAL